MPDEINSAVYIVDVDNLKQYNENFGHEYGDKILKKSLR